MAFHFGYWVTGWYDRIYGKNIYYFYLMTVYHILIPIWIVLFGFNQAHTFAIINPVTFMNSKSAIEVMDFKYLFVTVTWALIVVTLDMFFLVILKLHFKKTKLQLIKRAKPVIDYSKQLYRQTARKSEYFIDINFLSWKAITAIEIVVFFLSFYSAQLREVMLFLSLNTMQISVAYVIMLKIPFNLGRLLMITVAYSYLIKLFLFPIFH
jgi:hypothetical protein